MNNKQHFTIQKCPEYEYTCSLQIALPPLHRRDFVEKLDTLQITNFQQQKIKIEHSVLIFNII